jgi:hypothetical protein
MGYASRRPLIPTAPGLATVAGVEVFEAGRHRGDPYPVAFLDRVVGNFHRFTGEAGKRSGVTLDPPLVLGHDDEQAILAGSGLPAAGVVWNLWRYGTKLFADFNDVPPGVAKAINSRAYRKVSAEFRENFTDQGRDFGPALWRVALLGADQPQVKSLADLPLATFADEHDGRWPARVARIGNQVNHRLGQGRVVCFAEVAPMNRDDMIKSIKTIAPNMFSGPTLDSMSDEQIAMILKDLMAAQSGAAAGQAAAGANPDATGDQTQMADAGAAGAGAAGAVGAAPIAGMPGGAAPDVISPIPATPNPPVPPPSQITYKFADMQREMAAIRAEQAETRRIQAETRRLADLEKQRKDDAQVLAFWDEELNAGRRAPWQQTARKAELKGLDPIATLKFADVADKPMSPREYSHYVAMQGPPIVKMSEQFGGQTDPRQANESYQRTRMLEATPLGRSILKQQQQKALAAAAK